MADILTSGDKLTPEERARLLGNITEAIVTGELSAKQQAAKSAEEKRREENRQFSDKVGERDKVNRPPTGVAKPKSWFPNGMVDRQGK
jgi:hypothetical protein